MGVRLGGYGVDALFL